LALYACPLCILTRYIFGTFGFFSLIAAFNLRFKNLQNIFIFGSLFFGFVIAKKVSYLKEKIILSGFFSCFTSFSGFIYFLYKILNQGDWIKFIIFFNLIIILNIFTMYFGFWISRKIT
jgi:CrcB protein